MRREPEEEPTGLPGVHRREGEMTLSGPKLKRQRYLHGTKDDAAKRQKQRETPPMQAHDDVRQEEQTQHETPHEEREGGDDDLRQRRPWEQLWEWYRGGETDDNAQPWRK